MVATENLFPDVARLFYSQKNCLRLTHLSEFSRQHYIRKV